MSMTTYENTYGVPPATSALGVALPDGRVVPAHRIVGVAEVARLLTESGKFRDAYPDGVPRGRVSNWANRWRTTGFPQALPIAVERGLLWDADEVLAWTGPPGRWQRVDLNAPEEDDVPDHEEDAARHGL